MEFAAELGVQQVVFTNAAGGIHPQLSPGTLMIIRDHLFLQSAFSYRQPQPFATFTPGSKRNSPYSKEMIAIMQTIRPLKGIESLSNSTETVAGIYGAVTGPCYETPSEIKAFRIMGIDAVGMSTAIECETANRLSMQCAGISCITNWAAGIQSAPLHHQEVLQSAQKITFVLSNFLQQLIAALP